jgi:hypothetical protein
MIRRRLIATFVGASLFVVGGFATSGCAGDEDQPARGSISAPRNGGGVQDAAGEKTKPNAGPGGKLGAKGADL